MPCSRPVTSASFRRRRPSLRLSPPRIAAVLDLNKEGERAVHVLLRKLTTGRWPLWRLLSMQRRGDLLLVACEWLRCSAPQPFTVVEVALDRVALSWGPYPTADAARAALRAMVADDAQNGPAVRVNSKGGAA